MTFVFAAIGRNEIADYVSTLFYVYSLILIAYIISSLVQSLGMRIPYSRPVNAVLGFLRDVSEPYLRPFRRLLPNFGGFDFSPIIAFFVLRIVSSIVVSIIRG
jgi:YggT family protein